MQEWYVSNGLCLVSTSGIESQPRLSTKLESRAERQAPRAAGPRSKAGHVRCLWGFQAAGLNKEQGEVLERQVRMSCLMKTTRTSLDQHGQPPRGAPAQERIETTSLDHRTMRLLFSGANVPHGRLSVSSFAPCQANGPFVASSWAVDVALMHWPRRRLDSSERQRLVTPAISSTLQTHLPRYTLKPGQSCSWNLT